MSAKKIEVDPVVAKIQKILGEPVFCEFSDKTWRIRTNLIVISVISLVVVLADLHIESGSSVLGLKFTGLTDDVVRAGLFWVSIYLLAHFLWGAFDNFLEWRLRITGTRVAYVTTGMYASEHADYPSDPRQSTLYNWWRSQASSIGNIEKKMFDIEHELNEWIRKLREKYNSGSDAMNIVNACSSISETQRMITELKSSVKEAMETITSARIPASLLRFDKWFELFLRSQNLRWFLVELLFPVVIALSALWIL